MFVTIVANISWITSVCVKLFMNPLPGIVRLQINRTNTVPRYFDGGRFHGGEQTEKIQKLDRPESKTRGNYCEI